MTKPQNFITSTQPITLLVGVHAPYNKTHNIESYYEEFLNLAQTNGIESEHAVFIKLRTIEKSTYFTQGKLDELYKYVQDNDIEEVIISEPLSAVQEKNLEDYLHCKVFDRTQLILEIFEKHAISAEGKLQVEIAMLQQQKSRLAGKGVDMEQQRGVIGLRGGAGETFKEKAMRHINEHISKLRAHLQKIEQSRQTQRQQRIANKIPHICIIGYTNAGKSTLLNTLTKSDVLAADKPFATLDTTTRELYVQSKKVGLITDTVGFIQQLPHNLIEAFKSTLSELQYADLLVQVIDIADENWQSHIEVVAQILEDLGVTNTPMVYVFNKVDKLTPEQYEVRKLQMELYNPHEVIIATTKEGIKPLVEFIAQWSNRNS